MEQQATAKALMSETAMRLNPAFVSLLMNFPPAWVWPYALTGSAHLETASYRFKQVLHFESLCEQWGLTGDDTSET